MESSRSHRYNHLDKILNRAFRFPWVRGNFVMGGKNLKPQSFRISLTSSREIFSPSFSSEHISAKFCELIRRCFWVRREILISNSGLLFFGRPIFSIWTNIGLPASTDWRIWMIVFREIPVFFFNFSVVQSLSNRNDNLMSSIHHWDWHWESHAVKRKKWHVAVKKIVKKM